MGKYSNNQYDNYLQGYHSITWDDGSEYSGEWKDGLRHGYGKFTYAEGDFYDGNWSYDLKHGFGTYETVDGHRYEGEYINGLRHGYGAYTWPSGDKYEGNWFKGKQQGYGVYFWMDGARYEGQWENGKRHGVGKVIFADGNILQGRWEEGSYIDEAESIDTDIELIDTKQDETDDIGIDFFETNIKKNDDIDDDEPENYLNEDELLEVAEELFADAGDDKADDEDIDWGKNIEIDSSTNEKKELAGSTNKTLLKLTEINFYTKNAFRVLGQPVDASEKQINREGKKIIKQLKHNMPIDSNQVIKLPKLPDETNKFDERLIDDALTRLKDPESRLIDELFWFWPLNNNDSLNDEALIALSNGDFTKAYEIWKPLAQNGNFVAIHNQAVFSLYRALHMENYAQKKELQEKQLEKKHKLWQEVYDNWQACVSNDSIWAHVKERIVEIDDPRLNTDIAIELRNTVMLFLVYLSIDLALKAALKNNTYIAEQHIELINKLTIDNVLIDKVKQEKVKQYLENVTEILDEAEKKPCQNPNEGLKYLANLASEISDDLLLLKIVLSEENAICKGLIYKKNKVFRGIANRYISMAYGRAIEEAEKNPKDANKLATKTYEKAKHDIKFLKSRMPAEEDIINYFSSELSYIMNQILVCFYNNGGDPKTTKMLLEKAFVLAKAEQDKELIQEGLDHVNAYANCCFCKNNYCDDDAAYKIIMCKNEVINDPLLKYPIDDYKSQYIEVTLPRCFDCKSKHEKLVVVDSHAENLGGIGIGLGGLFGVFISLAAQSFIVTLILGGLFAFLGSGVGNFIGGKFKKQELVDRADLSKVRFPPLEKLKMEGWKNFGK